MARQLRTAGLDWKPAPGDRFVIPDRDLDDEVFVLSNMTVEVHTMPEGQVIGFNGTTEWAMDDVEIDEAVWLPREDQLRELLGAAFRALVRTPSGGYRVELADRAFEAAEPEDAYAQAVLEVL